MSRRNLVRSLLPLALLASCAGEEQESAFAPQPQTAGVVPKRTPKPAAANASKPSARGAETRVDLSSFVPADAFVWLQLESIDALDEAASALIQLGGEDTAAMWDMEMLLAQASMFLPGADMAQIDRRRPMGVAFSLAQGAPEGQPVPTFVLPVRDPARFAGSLSMPGIAEPLVEGNYVGFSMAPTYELNASPGSFATDMPDAQVVLRIHLGRVVPQFRPMIDMGMAQARQGIESMPVDDEYGDLSQAMATSYLDGAGSFLDSAEVFELAFSLESMSLRFDMGVSMRDGSTLAGFGSPEATDFARLAGFLNDQATFSAVAGFDPESMRERFGGFIESMAELAPTGGASPESLAYMWDFLDLYGTAVAVDADFEPGNLRAAYYADPPNHDEFLAGFARLAGQVEELSFGALALDGPVETSVDDVRLVQYRLRGGEATSPEAREFQQGMALFCGAGAAGDEVGLMVTLASTPDHIATILASENEAGDAWTDLALSRLAIAGGTPSGALGSAVASIQDANPAFAYSWDMARLFRQSLEMAKLAGELEGADVAELEQMPDIPEGLSVPVTSFFGVDGRHWRGGFFVQVEDLMTLMHSIDG